MLAILLSMAQMAAADPAPQAPLAPPAADAAAEEGRVVERIVAVLRSPGLPPRPVTLITLTEEARVALAAQGATDAATAPLDAAALRAALHWVIDQRLVSDEAVRLKVDEVPRDEVEAARARFRERFGAPAAYQAFLAAAGLSDRAVGVMLERDLRVRHYLASRVGRSGRVTEEELDRELRDQGGGAASPAAREAARARLEEARLREALRQQVADLRARVEVRVLDPALREDDPR